MIERLAREAGINVQLARPGDDGIDTWFGDQFLPNGALKRFAAQVAEECAKHADDSEPESGLAGTFRTLFGIGQIDSVNGDGAKGTENTGPRPSDDSRALPSTKSVQITLLMIAREMQRLTGAKHCQVVRAYDGPRDSYMMQCWADGRWTGMPVHTLAALGWSLDAFSAEVCVPTAEALKLAADGAEPFKAPRGHANYEFAEVRA